MIRRTALALAGAALFLPACVTAQEAYRQPPPPIAQILDAAPTPSVSLSPDRRSLLLMERAGLPSITEVAAPELRLAGTRIDPRTNGPSRQFGFSALRVIDVETRAERAIATPSGARVLDPQWSSNGSHVSFTVASDSGMALWVADASTGRARPLTSARLNGAASRPCKWMRDALLCMMIPDSRDAAPVSDATPSGPIVQEAGERAAPNRTYQDLLESPADEALFDHYFTSQLARVSLDGTVRPIGAAGMHVSSAPSPDERFILVETLERPYSYVVPYSRFPRRIAVWDVATGAQVHEVARRPLQDEVPISFDAVIAGPRSVDWRADAPATLYWVEALDGGDVGTRAELRDRLVMLPAPFSGTPVTLLESSTRVGDVIWAREDLALVTDRWRRTRQTRTYVVNPSRPDATPRVLFDLSSEDRYRDPGQFSLTRDARGQAVLQLTPDGRSAFLLGSGASPEGDRPFIDRIEIATGRTQRLWRSAAPHYEVPTSLLDNQGRRFLTRRESPVEPPNFFMRTTGSTRVTQLTRFPDPAPQFSGLTGEIIRYRRADGVELSGTLYLPPGYDRSQGPLPFLLWAYPREFRSADAAAQVSGSPHRFTRPSGASHLFLLTQGYGILDGPSMPIVGEGDEEPNDRYVEQLVSSAQAAVDEIVRRGVADRERIAVGGHSYGAFMTANLLAHSKIFRAGIARSGAYNRTLTPFGFQAEERPFWEAREIYMGMSPFTYADQVSAPILLIHGMADNNSGTFPVQSERFYQALRGNGKTVRYVQLPAESHGYAARESVGHSLWEMVTWLDRWVKNGALPRAD